MRVDSHLVDAGVKEYPDEGDSQPQEPEDEKPGGSGSGGGSRPGDDDDEPGGDNRPGDDDEPGEDEPGGTPTVSFEAEGVEEGRLPTIVGSVLTSLPTPYRDGYIFQGWFYDQAYTRPAAEGDTVSADTTLYAKWLAYTQPQASETPHYAAQMDVPTSFTITVHSSDAGLNAEAVKGMLSATDLSTDQVGELLTVSGSGGTYTIAGADGGFRAGGTYHVVLEDECLTFADQEASVREYHFTVARVDEVMNLQLKPGVVSIPSSAISNIVQEGQEVAALDLSLVTVSGEGTQVEDELTEGTFTYTGTGIQVGDTVAVYDGLAPEDRTPDKEGSDKLAGISYVVITDVRGDTYTYESAEVEDVVFTPDILPVSNAYADTDGDNSITVPVAEMTYTDDVYNEMGLDSQTTVDAGDFMAFYTGEFTENEQQTARSAVVYARIDTVGVDETGENYVITYTPVEEEEVLSAMEVYDEDPITDMLEDVDQELLEESLEEQAVESGFAQAAADYLAAVAMETPTYQRMARDAGIEPMALPGVPVEVTKVRAHVQEDLEHFTGQEGLRVELELGIAFETQNGLFEISLDAAFIQEVKLNIELDGSPEWKWLWGFIPYIGDYNIQVNLDVYAFTDMDINATIASQQAGGIIAVEDIEDFVEELKEKLNGGANQDEIDTLQEQYKAMLEVDSDWMDLFEQRLWKVKKTAGLIFTLQLEVTFVVSGNVKIAMGCDFWYENAKRYTYNIKLFAGKVANSTTNLTSERYEFNAYVMGVLGLRAGIRISFDVSIISKKLATVGVSAEAGVYANLYGYFLYELKYAEGEGRRTNSSGAMMAELGIYLDIAFNADVFNGGLTWNPSIYSTTWPMWSIGSYTAVEDFKYTQEEAPDIQLKNDILSTTLPDSLFEMSAFDLTTGEDVSKIYNDATDFVITMTNDAFRYDPNTNTLTVDADPNSIATPVIEGQMIITWIAMPLAFSSTPLQRVVDLRWDNLKDSYIISFDSQMGSYVPSIVAAYQTPLEAPADPTRAGYNFVRWRVWENGEDITYTVPDAMPNWDTQAQAVWEPRDDTPYTVKYYLEDEQGLYQFYEEEIFQGTTEAHVDAERQTYAGYDTPALQQAWISGDGSEVVYYTYDRSEYTITFASGMPGVDNITITAQYGKPVSAPPMAAPGYTFAGWDQSIPETMPDHDMLITAQWTPNADTPYRVEHYLQDADGGYTLAEDGVEFLSGTTGSPVQVTLRTYQGLQPGYYDTAATIAADGSTVVKVRYDRNKYTLTFDANGGEFAGGVVTEIEYPYGAQVELPGAEDVTRSGYAFTGWYTDQACAEESKFDGVMPMGDTTLYAGWDADGVNYKVEHYQQDLNLTSYTLVETESDLYADPDTQVTPETKTYEGFTAPETQTVTVAADGSTVVEYKYTRNSYKLTWNLGGTDVVVGEGAFTDATTGSATEAVEVLYGAPITFPDTSKITRPGYSVAGVYTDPEFQNEVASGEYTMPAQDQTLYIKWGEVTYTFVIDPRGNIPLKEALLALKDSGITVEEVASPVEGRWGTNLPKAVQLTLTGSQTITLPEVDGVLGYGPSEEKDDGEYRPKWEPGDSISGSEAVSNLDDFTGGDLEVRWNEFENQGFSWQNPSSKDKPYIAYNADMLFAAEVLDTVAGISGSYTPYVKVGADMEVGGYGNSLASGKRSDMHVDGADHTLYNVYRCNGYSDDGGSIRNSGTIAALGDNCTVKDLTIDGITYDGEGWNIQKINFGGLVGSVGANFTAENVTVKNNGQQLTINATVPENSYVGGLIGKVNSSATLTNCKVEGFTVHTQDETTIGGLIGGAAEGATITITDCTYPTNYEPIGDGTEATTPTEPPAGGEGSETGDGSETGGTGEGGESTEPPHRRREQ